MRVRRAGVGRSQLDQPFGDVLDDVPPERVPVPPAGYQPRSECLVRDDARLEPAGEAPLHDRCQLREVIMFVHPNNVLADGVAPVTPR